MSRDSALAIRASPARESFNRLLEIAEVDHGDIDFSILRQAISAHYECLEVERRGVVRSMQIMSEEAMCLTRDIREQTTSHLQSILDNVKDAILTLDYAGHIETFNPTGEKIFGYSVTEILGRSINFLLPEIDSNGTRAFLDSCASRSDDTRTDLAAHQTWGVSKQGKRIPLEVCVSSAKFNSREGFILCIRDCTERHFAEKLIRDSETRAASIAAGEHRIFEKIAANAALLSILETICAVIQQVVEDASCAISFYDADAKCLNYGVAPNLTREFVVAMDGTPTGIRFGSCAAAVYLARQVIVADVEQDALWEYRRDAALAAGLKAAWSTPIVASQTHIVGSLAVYRRNPGLPASRDYELIARMTQIAGIAIERRSAEDALRESEARFRGLFTLWKASTKQLAKLNGESLTQRL